MLQTRSSCCTRSWKRAASTLALLVGVCGPVVSIASAQLRIVTYNVAKLNGNQIEMPKVFQALTEDPQPITGVVRAPDVYVFQELSNASTLTTLWNYINDTAPPGVTYATATFTVNGGGGENGLIYRTDTLLEDPVGHADIENHTGPRATDRWRMRLASDVNQFFYIYGSHFRADVGPTFRAQRASEADAIRNDADALGEGRNVIYAGDWNVYTPDEPAFERFFDTGAGRAVDPLFAGLFPDLSHTQSPHDGSAGLTTGGMDNRFDFQLCTEEFEDGSGFEVLADSYRSFGNDGLHFNQAINAGNNTYFTLDEQWKADALAKASDHLPVVVDYEVPGNPFVLEVDPLIAGLRGTFAVRGATPNQQVYFVYSRAGLGETPVGQLNVTLRLSQPLLLGSARAGGSGFATLRRSIPSNAGGIRLWVQAAQVGAVTDVVYRLID